MPAAAETPTTQFHLSLNVADVERSRAFYEAFFGVPAHKRRPGYANFDLARPALKLALNQNPPERGRGALNHLGLVVPSIETVNETRVRLEASGLVTFDEADTVCCYVRQDKVWVQDPDGNRWEVYVLLDDMLDEEHEDGTDGTVMSCCSPSGMKMEPIAFGEPAARGCIGDFAG